MYHRLYDGFRKAIVDSRIRPGQRVPSSRGLAAELGISRISVLSALRGCCRKATSRPAAERAPVWPARFRISLWRRQRATYAERLARERSSKARGGSPARGGIGRRPVGLGATLSASESPAGARPLPPRAVGEAGGPQCASDPGPQTWRTGTRWGIRPFARPSRSILALPLASVRPSQVLVTTGSQQALPLCARVLLNPGDGICLEEPGCPAPATPSAPVTRKSCGPVDRERYEVERMARQAKSARAVYLTPRTGIRSARR